ncbi:unnamed protein product [Mytilus coruscus]|uniref:Uncharacterized protein n=1 Tax=Mytilus coruscus TaxID=42192 RepID=A0A6J8EKQ4_MYTCO|nr:unnamed protein product [Mytilus coruscus]
MEEMIFKYSYVRPERMTDIEIAVLNDLSEKSKDEIDPVKLVYHLYKTKTVDQYLYEEFHQKTYEFHWPNRRLCEFLLQKLQNVCSFRTLINALRESGHHNISRMLLEKQVLPTSTVARVCRIDTSNRKQVQQYFKMLKRKVWNAEFKDPLNTLRSLAKRLQMSMLREKDCIKKQLIADRVVAVLGAEIDAHAITFNTELSDHDLFKELREIVPFTTNTMVTDVILYGRQANACAIGKYFSQGEKYLQLAKSCSAFMTPCLELANMIYCEVYVRLWQFEQNPNHQIRESLVQMAEVGIECLRDEEEEIRLLWTRMFLLRMTFCLLGIGNRATIIQNCIITIECIKKARNVLGILDKTLDNMDTRREMFYLMARARLFEIEDELSLAFEYIKKSFRLAMEGKFKEQCFICQYMKYIEQRMDIPDASNDEQDPVELNQDSFEGSQVSIESINGIEMNRPETVIHHYPSNQDNSPQCNSQFISVRLVSVPELDANSFKTTGGTLCTDNSFCEIFNEQRENTAGNEETQSTYEVINLESTAKIDFNSFDVISSDEIPNT